MSWMISVESIAIVESKKKTAILLRRNPEDKKSDSFAALLGSRNSQDRGPRMVWRLSCSNTDIRGDGGREFECVFETDWN